MSNTSRKLNGKVALITGASSGIGSGTAIEMASEGASVVVHYLDDKEGADATLHEVEKDGGRAVVIQADVSFEDDVERMFDEAISALGPVDILVNNAGIDTSGVTVSEMSTDQWDKIMRVNRLWTALLLSPVYSGTQQDRSEGQDHQHPLDS